jgi:hypothetical protein
MSTRNHNQGGRIKGRKQELNKESKEGIEKGEK